MKVLATKLCWFLTWIVSELTRRLVETKFEKSIWLVLNDHESILNFHWILLLKAYLKYYWLIFPGCAGPDGSGAWTGLDRDNQVGPSPTIEERTKRRLRGIGKEPFLISPLDESTFSSPRWPLGFAAPSPPMCSAAPRPACLGVHPTKCLLSAPSTARVWIPPPRFRSMSQVSFQHSFPVLLCPLVLDLSGHRHTILLCLPCSGVNPYLVPRCASVGSC